MKSIPLEEIALHMNDISWSVLTLINQKEKIGINEIKKEIGLSQEKTYKELARLEGALLISTIKDPKDLRTNLYVLSEYGQALLEIKTREE